MKTSLAVSLTVLSLTASAAEMCRVGQNISVLWQNEWYKATVTATSPGQCKVTYEGYGKDQDEWVGPDRMKIKVMWKGDWYPAKVVRREGANYLVSYDGYGQDDNEIVPVSRIEVR